ncbi:outer membrane protein assembly factor BamE [Thorsellia kenyensis]|uniref:Outer membrane protein assembly factor BamE n=1 Tax=Thorsellia kenyensis TaxID=1549888 RepID=A0ABV6C9A7_9GAMM
MRNSVQLTLGLTLAALFTLTGCKTILYKPDINQGNYLEAGSAQTIERGMNQEQVKFLLGTPITTDIFDKNKWIYLYRQEPSRQSLVQEQLVVTFDEQGTVIDITHQPRTNL